MKQFHASQLKILVNLYKDACMDVQASYEGDTCEEIAVIEEEACKAEQTLDDYIANLTEEL